MSLTLTPIGRLRTPYPTRDDCPRNGRQFDPPPLCHAEIFPEYQPGLAGIETFSHLILLYHLADHAHVDLVFIPPFATEQRGIFATRAPWRPNHIGLSVVKFEGLSAPGTLDIRYLDCIDGTALLDIKPYLRTVDCEPEATLGWLEPHAGKRIPIA